MWIPPWAHGHMALGAYGDRSPASPEDRVIADRTAAAVSENIRAGRPFYDPVPREFHDKFQRSARQMYRYLLDHPEYMIKGMTPEERKEVATKVVNKTYYNALRGIRQLRGESSLKGWFFKISRNALIDELRMWIRNPEGEARRAQYRFDSGSDAEKAALLRAEAEIAAASAEFELSDASFQKLVQVIQKALVIGHDARGREFISKKDAEIFRAYLKSGGDKKRMAHMLRMREDVAFALLDEATDHVGEWIVRLQETLAARGETI